MKTFGVYLTLLGISLLLQMILQIESSKKDDDPTCLPSTFKLIQIYDKLIPGFDNISIDTSLKDCSELCGSSNVCESFGFNTLNNTCYLYVKRVKMSLDFDIEVGMVYYWLLRDSCPKCYQKNSNLSLCFRMFPFDSKIESIMEAEEICEKDDGHLIIIDSDEKGKFLSQVVENSDNVKGFVGGVKLGTGTGDWYWYNGANVNNWLTDQPDDYDDTEDCLQAIFNDNTTIFNDIPCQISQSFICEIPIV